MNCIGLFVLQAYVDFSINGDDLDC